MVPSLWFQCLHLHFLLALPHPLLLHRCRLAVDQSEFPQILLPLEFLETLAMFPLFLLLVRLEVILSHPFPIQKLTTP